MREALEQLALLRFARLIVGQLGSISSLSLIPTIHSFSSLRAQHNTHGVLANPDSSQAMAPSKQKRTHTVFRASSAHRSTSTSKPRFVGEKVKLGGSCAFIAFDYQLDRHCSKTPSKPTKSCEPFDYQLDRHCSKTRVRVFELNAQFDYQLDRHCSKTRTRSHLGMLCLITS